jgi:oligopeptide/dipeptide ABC transporter ATP-binding protein
MGAMLSASNLVKNFATSAGIVKAVNDVSFDLESRCTLALVGESGCGKSTIASAILRLIDIDAGAVNYEGQDIAVMNMNNLQIYRRNVSIVFQNPYSSLNPKMKIREIVGEPLKVCYGIKGKELSDRVEKHLSEVGIGSEHINRFPHQFSGGQRQRIAIARAIALEPKILILDEPTAALDVSVQAQILNLFQDLKQRLGLSYLFISHNLATVEYIADRVMVMYLGKIVEQGPVESIFENPAHPYTRALLDSVPSLDPANRHQLKALHGELPDPTNLPVGCAFYSRCDRAQDLCKTSSPDLLSTSREHAVACFFPITLEKDS